MFTSLPNSKIYNPLFTVFYNVKIMAEIMKEELLSFSKAEYRKGYLGIGSMIAKQSVLI